MSRTISEYEQKFSLMTTEIERLNKVLKTKV